jgi:hypothetical protein
MVKRHRRSTFARRNLRLADLSHRPAPRRSVSAALVATVRNTVGMLSGLGADIVPPDLSECRPCCASGRSDRPLRPQGIAAECAGELLCQVR